MSNFQLQNNLREVYMYFQLKGLYVCHLNICKLCLIITSNSKIFQIDFVHYYKSLHKTTRSLTAVISYWP